MRGCVDRIINHLGPSLVLGPRKRFRKGTVLIVGATLAEQAKKLLLFRI